MKHYFFPKEPYFNDFCSPGGFLDPVRFYYKVGETAEFFCNPGLVINGTKMIKCLGRLIIL